MAVDTQKVVEILYGFYFFRTDFETLCKEYDHLPPLVINGIITGSAYTDIFNTFMEQAEYRESL